MDDGGLLRKKKKHKDGTRYFLRPSSILCTHGFSEDEVDLIVSHLHGTFGVSGSKNLDNGNFRLWFDVANTQRIWALIKPFADEVPSMRTKFDLCYELFNDLSNTSARHRYKSSVEI